MVAGQVSRLHVIPPSLSYRKLTESGLFYTNKHFHSCGFNLSNIVIYTYILTFITCVIIFVEHVAIRTFFFHCVFCTRDVAYIHNYLLYIGYKKESTHSLIGGDVAFILINR